MVEAIILGSRLLLLRLLWLYTKFNLSRFIVILFWIKPPLLYPNRLFNYRQLQISQSKIMEERWVVPFLQKTTLSPTIITPITKTKKTKELKRLIASQKHRHLREQKLENFTGYEPTDLTHGEDVIDAITIWLSDWWGGFFHIFPTAKIYKNLHEKRSGKFPAARYFCFRCSICFPDMPSSVNWGQRNLQNAEKYWLDAYSPLI